MGHDTRGIVAGSLPHMVGRELLRHHRAVVFDEAGEFTGDGFDLRLDPELGIVIPHADEGDE